MSRIPKYPSKILYHGELLFRSVKAITGGFRAHVVAQGGVKLMSSPKC